MIADPYSRIRYSSNQPKEGPTLPWLPDDGGGGNATIRMDPLVGALKERMNRPDAPAMKIPMPDINVAEPEIPAPNIPEYGKRKVPSNGFGGAADGGSGGGFQSL